MSLRENLSEILIQVLLLDSRLLLLDSSLTLSPQKRLKERSTRKKLVVGSRRRNRMLNRWENRSYSCWEERSSKGSCYSWLGLKEAGGTSLLCRGKGGRHQGRSRDPWGLIGGVGGQGWDLLKQVIEHFLGVRAHCRDLTELRYCWACVPSYAVGETRRGSIQLSQGLSCPRQAAQRGTSQASHNRRYISSCHSRSDT